jgi:hypothetical protein
MIVASITLQNWKKNNNVYLVSDPCKTKFSNDVISIPMGLTHIKIKF